MKTLQVGMCKADLASAVEWRDWYQQQLQSAQEQRNSAQDEIVALQKDVSAKNESAAILAADVESNRDVAWLDGYTPYSWVSGQV